METRLESESRASAQREGGFAVGQRVKTGASWAGPANAGFEVEIIRLDDNCAWTTTHPSIADGSPCFFLKDLEPADPATAPPGGQVFRYIQIIADPTLRPNEVKLLNHAGKEVGRFTMPTEPPQPAPMTRAARVLAGMMADPYEQARNKVEARIGLDTQNHLDHYTATATDNEPKQQAARLRMAKLTLDRPLDAERARWERLVLAKVPVGRR